MTIKLVSSVSSSNNGGPSSNIDTTGANFLATATAGGSDPSITDSKSNTWHGLTIRDTVNRYRLRLHYAFSAASGTGHNFTMNAANGSSVMAAFSGLKASADPFHSENGGVTPIAGGDDSFACGEINPPNSSEVLLIAAGGIDDPAGNAMLCSDGFALIARFDVVPGSTYGVSLFYKVVNRGGIRYNPVISRQTKNTQSGDAFADAVFLGTDFLRGRFPPQQRRAA